MSFELRLLWVGLGAFALVGLATAVAVPALMSRVAAGSASLRARRLTMLRLLPATAAAVAAVLVTASFLNFEPRSDEYIGWMIPGLAVVGAAMLAAAGLRAAKIALATRRLTRAWLAGGESIVLDGINVPALAIASRFPIVAVVGVRRPRLVIARSVLESCTPEELRAVLAHEQGHLDRHDNLRRLLMASAPDALAWLPSSARLATAWHAATEEAADADAARTGDDGHLCLASALIKVAKLASGGPARGVMPASALYCGENIDGRVRRLLEPRPVVAIAAPAPRRIRTGAALACALMASSLALGVVQAVIEFTIHRLP